MMNETNNSKIWTREYPGFIIFLVDQSESMNTSYPENDNKANFTAMVINRTINDLTNIAAAGDKVRDVAFISIIGYGDECGDSVYEIRSGYLSQFADNPLRIENGKQKVSDGNGGFIEINVQNPIFVNPVAQGNAPMGSALEFTKELIDAWLSDKPGSPAPVIIHISDGLPCNREGSYDEKAKAIIAAFDIMNLSCEDGNPLLFNVYIGNVLTECMFNATESELPDEQAKFLFSISSKIPESCKFLALRCGFSVCPDSRGFISNATPEFFIGLFRIGWDSAFPPSTKSRIRRIRGKWSN